MTELAGIEIGVVLALLAMGLFSGFLAGLLGVGGGMVMVPLLTWLFDRQGLGVDLSVKMAIATAMATITFTSLSSIRAHQRRGAILWPVVAQLAPGIFLGALLASAGVFVWIKGSGLAFVFAVFVAFSASQMLLDKKPQATRNLPSGWGLTGVGGGIGFLSGLVGAGGGFISVPFMTWCNVAMHRAVATSAAIGLPIALSNVLGYIISGSHASGLPAHSLGYIYLPALAFLASASVLAAPFGAEVAHALPVRQLRHIFACMLFALAAYMFYRGCRA